MNSDKRIKSQLMDADDIERTLNRMTQQIIEMLDPDDPHPRLALVGMQSRGVYLAQRLRDKIMATEGLAIEFGMLDVTMYRDDFRHRLTQPTIRKTDILFDVNGCHIVLVDDVLYTGRTARSGLEALLDLGRPASVRFLVMIDRGLRELPVSADIFGRFVPTTKFEGIRVRLREYDAEEGVWLVENAPAT